MPPSNNKRSGKTYIEVRYTDIEPNPLNPRRIFDKLKLDVLEESVRANKILVPLTAYRDQSSQKLYILDGERRWRCAVRIETGEVSTRLRSRPADLVIPVDAVALNFDEDTKVLAHRGPIDSARAKQLLTYSNSSEWKKAIAALQRDSATKPPRRVPIPVNVVDPPTPAANMLYMFHVHNLREEWNLMPTALSLRILMKELGETEDTKLAELTQLSEPNVKRCKMLLSFKTKYQQMMLHPDPDRRLKANLFIEMYPVLDLYDELGSRVRGGRTRDELTDLFIEKYRDGLIPSVVHFRKILEARDLLRDTDRWDEVAQACRRFIAEPKLKIKSVFDPLVAEQKQVHNATELCKDFLARLRKLKVEHATSRRGLVAALKQVLGEIQKLLESLSGED